MKFNSTAALVTAALILAGAVFCAVAIIAPGLLSNVPLQAQVAVALALGLGVALTAMFLTDPLEDPYLGH
jgi:hypothetical protein